MAEEEQKKQECPPGAPVWMCTFADLMSLLMCFFILLLSFSVMDAQKYYKVAGSMKDAFGTQKEIVEPSSLPGTEMISPSFQSVPLHVQIRVARALSEEIEGGVVQADYTEQGLILKAKDSVAYESGSATIKEGFFPFLDKLGKLAQEMDLSIEVGGHTDNQPLRQGKTPFKSNWSLSAARSVRIVEYWVENLKIVPEKLSATAFADSRPIALNDSVEGRAANRRVEFKIRPASPEVIVTGLEFDKQPAQKIN